jgi:hypothetical protein
MNSIPKKVVARLDELTPWCDTLEAQAKPAPSARTSSTPNL